MKTSWDAEIARYIQRETNRRLKARLEELYVYWLELNEDRFESTLRAMREELDHE